MFKPFLVSCRTCITENKAGQYACTECQISYLHFEEVQHEFLQDTENPNLDSSTLGGSMPAHKPAPSLLVDDSATPERLASEDYDDSVSQSVQQLMSLR